jgi:hypothetical protein
MRERQSFQERFVRVKEDLLVWHCRKLEACFRGEDERKTIPKGWLAMFDQLEEHVKKNNHSAVLGLDLKNSARSAYGELKEFLGVIFTEDCKIAGRDRRIMDEMYMSAFEMYDEQTFPLIVCSKRGKGKSLRAERLVRLLPENWASTDAAASSRAGMNGNSASNNGKWVVYDEMISDLTTDSPNERLEYWKQITTKREYSLERTRTIKKSDGSEAHVTVRIVTPHNECHCICTNMGPMFTTPGKVPTSGKEAMVQRTICVFARSQTSYDAPNDEFERHISDPTTKARIDQFRMLTVLTGFCKLAVKGMSWLIPDLGYADRLFAVFDDILVKEYNLPRPDPRRTRKRRNVLLTMCALEAVARVFVYKQKADVYMPSKRDKDGNLPTFDCSHLLYAIRSMHPTREMITDAWSMSLEYSIGTSMFGTALMTTVAQTVLSPSRFGAKFSSHEYMADVDMNNQPPLVGRLIPSTSKGKFATRDVAPTAMPSHDDLQCRLDNMADRRRVCADFDRNAVADESITPTDGINNVTNSESQRLAYRNGLFPDMATATLFYEDSDLINWALGKDAEPRNPRQDTLDPIRGTKHCKGIVYKSVGVQGSSKTFDRAWAIVGHEPKAGKDTVLQVSRLLENSRDGACYAFQMHDEGITDTLRLLMSTENERICKEMPNLPDDYAPERAFVDSSTDGELIPQTSDRKVAVRTVIINGTKTNANETLPFDTRMGDLTKEKAPIQRGLDALHERCRLPSLLPLSSTKTVSCPPFRICDTSGFEANVSVLVQHLLMLFEASLRCAGVHGCSGVQERLFNESEALALSMELRCTKREVAWKIADYFPVHRACPSAVLPHEYVPFECPTMVASKVRVSHDKWTNEFETSYEELASFQINAARLHPYHVLRIPKATSGQFVYYVHDNDPRDVDTLPFSYDLLQIAWTVDVASRFYAPSACAVAKAFNAELNWRNHEEARPHDDSMDEGAFAKEMVAKWFPEMTLRFPGLKCQDTRDPMAVMLLSLPLAVAPTTEAVPLDIECVGDVHVSKEKAVQEASIRLGRLPTNDEVDDYIAITSKPSRTYGVQGDIFSLDTWTHHAYMSMRERGNTIEELCLNGWTQRDDEFLSLIDAEYMTMARRCAIRKKEQLPAADSYTYRAEKDRLSRDPLMPKKCAQTQPHQEVYNNRVKHNQANGTLGPPMVWS